MKITDPSRLGFLLLICTCVFHKSKQEEKVFRNPILDGDSADPAAIRLGGYYYLTLSDNGAVLTILRSQILTDFRKADKFIAYTIKEGQSNLWAPEMHIVNGELYIYFCMDGNGKDHRMYAIKAEDPTDPFSDWSDAISLMPDQPGIDGTIMKHGNGNLYYVWASGGWLWIARLFDPVTIGESKLILRKPTSWWEQQGQVTNEGPFFLYNKNTSFLVFSASFTFEPNYCLGMMSIEGHKDPMVPSNWWFGEDRPVFWRNDEESVYTTGHASFTVSPDGTETWMVYHATANTTHIAGFRNARLEKIDWDENGYPIFPRPHGYDHPQTVPSGQV